MTTTRPSTELIERSRELRHTPTLTEDILWRHLRNRRLNGLKFRRQHPISRFILDFYCEDMHLDIEIDASGHLEPDQAEYDLFRTRTLNDLGIRVLRFWNEDVINKTEKVLDEIYRVILVMRKEKM